MDSLWHLYVQRASDFVCWESYGRHIHCCSVMESQVSSILFCHPLATSLYKKGRKMLVFFVASKIIH